MRATRGSGSANGSPSAPDAQDVLRPHSRRGGDSVRKQRAYCGARTRRVGYSTGTRQVLLTTGQAEPECVGDSCTPAHEAKDAVGSRRCLHPLGELVRGAAPTSYHLGGARRAGVSMASLPERSRPDAPHNPHYRPRRCLSSEPTTLAPRRSDERIQGGVSEGSFPHRGAK
eukprot:2473601-Prymnesium_polylepis.1